MLRVDKRVNNENSFYLPKKGYHRLFEENLIEVNGKKINGYFIRNIFYIEKLYNYALRVFEGEVPSFKICCEEHSSDNKDIEFSKVEVLLLLHKMVEMDAKNPDIEDSEKLKLDDLEMFENYCSYDKMIEKNKGIIKKYSIDGNVCEVKFDDIWNFFNTPEEEYQKLLNSNTINGIKKEYFLYSCVKYFNSYVVDEYMLPNDVYKRFKSLSLNEVIDIESLNVLTSNANPESSLTKINKQLRNAILGDMPESLSKLEKSIYVYIKMCKVLSYDDEFYVFNQKGKKLTRDHKDIDYISSVTPNNSKVVCYEFNAIYAKFLEKLGINCGVERSFFGRYGSGHASLGFRVDKYLLSADSTTSILSGDMIKAKLNEPLVGLTCFNMNKESQNEFKNALNNVYGLIIDSEKKSGLDEILFEYRNIKEKEGKKTNVDIDKKLNILISIINTLEINDMDRVAFVLYLMKKTFNEEEKKSVYTNIIKSKAYVGNNYYASPAIIFTIVKNNGYLEYYQYTLGRELEKIDERYLETLFALGTYGYIDENREKIPGIRSGMR